jgi:hypothetical protein
VQDADLGWVKDESLSLIGISRLAKYVELEVQ